MLREKENLIEVFSESSREEDEYEDGEARDSQTTQDHFPPPPPGAGGAAFAPTGGTLAALRGVPKYLTLRVRGTVRG